MVKAILDLCGGSGAWSMPYREDPAYKVIVIDPVCTLPDAIREDVRTWEPIDGKVHGILAAPPCQHLSAAGNQFWEIKGRQKLLHALSVVDACMQLILLYEPEWWCLENPPGRLSRWMGMAPHWFQPWWYGAKYTKRTMLWGNFNMPPQEVMVRPRKLDDRLLRREIGAAARAVTPAGFTRAFKEANP